jgi:cobalt/nickel transport system permease protein
MEHDFLDKYSRIESFLSRLDPRVKIVSFMTLMVCIVSTDPTAFAAFAIYGTLLTVLTRLSGIPFIDVLKKMIIAVPFVMLTVLFVPFVRGGTIVYSWSLGPATLHVTREGLLLLWNVCIKASLSLLSAILMTATTRFPDFLKALEKLRCPQIFIMVSSFMYRYIFVIQDELMMMQQAKESRSAGGSRLLHLRALAGMIGVLFIRSYERAESVYLAMCSRGFSGSIRTFHDFRVTGKDAVFVLTIIAFVIGLKLLGR